MVNINVASQTRRPETEPVPRTWAVLPFILSVSTSIRN